jgi:transcriptional regulator GlxA family with amidase domain
MKKNIAILIFDDVEVLDFAGPFEVFAVTDELLGHEPFHTFTLALRPGSIRARNGLKIVPDFTLENCVSPDVLVIPGGQGTRALLNMPALHEWIRLKSRTAEIVMSVCTGALVLAQAGLLEGLRATTHHSAFELLRRLAPRTEIAEHERFVDNGRIITAAGISAGIDCSLHVVARLLGEETANRTAAEMEYERPVTSARRAADFKT